MCGFAQDLARRLHRKPGPVPPSDDYVDGAEEQEDNEDGENEE